MENYVGNANPKKSNPEKSLNVESSKVMKRSTWVTLVADYYQGTPCISLKSIIYACVYAAYSAIDLQGID
jgi:hypothetical protein